MVTGASLNHITAGLFVAGNKEIITVSGVKSLSPSKYTKDGKIAKRIFITVETAQIRYWYDGSTPKSTEGHIANPFSTITLVGSSNIKNFKCIAVSGTPKLMISYEF